VGDVCVIGCDDGFELIGCNTRTCLGDQTWSGTEATCVEQPGKLNINLLPPALPK